MKVKINTLALELNISDNTLTHWLARKGYPGARSQDWLTPHLAKIARKELKPRSSSYASLSLNLEQHTPERFRSSLPLPIELRRELEEQAISKNSQIYPPHHHKNLSDFQPPAVELNRPKTNPKHTLIP